MPRLRLLKSLIPLPLTLVPSILTILLRLSSRNLRRHLLLASLALAASRALVHVDARARLACEFVEALHDVLVLAH